MVSVYVEIVELAGKKLKGALLVFLVCAQGLMGWYMVKSGLVKDPEVSHFRLAAHLSLAFAIFGLAWWTSLGLMPKSVVQSSMPTNNFRSWAIVLVSVLFLQIVYGAFTSGMKAGYGFNTYPMMGGEVDAGGTLFNVSFLDEFCIR